MSQLLFPSAVGLMLLVGGSSLLAQRGPLSTLDPKTYASPSGEFKLQVNPSTIYGQGEGAHRLSKDGKEIWSKSLLFTLCDAEVTDDGTVAGYAYSLGYENMPIDRNQDEDGKLHIVILDPTGGLRMNAALPRSGSFSCTSTVDRNVRGFFADPENDRFVVRCQEGGWSSGGEIWRTYQLSTGKLLDEIRLAHAEKSERESWFLWSAKPLAGTPLIILYWQYKIWDDNGNDLRAYGAEFNLIDGAGRVQWELNRPNDTPDYYEYSKRLDQEKDQGEWQRLSAIESQLREHGAILKSSQPGQFDLWFVAEMQRATFATAKAGDKWIVHEQARAAYTWPERTTPPTPELSMPAMTLRPAGTIQLDIRSAPLPAIRAIKYFDLDGRGNLGMLRQERMEAPTFLLADVGGKVLLERNLFELTGPNCNLVTANWLEGSRWLVMAHRWNRLPGEKTSEAVTVGAWLDVTNGRLTPIASFPQGARHVTGLKDGGFALVIEPKLGTGIQETVASFDRNGKELWRFGAVHDEGLTFGTSGIVELSDGKVVITREYGHSLTFLNADGSYIRNVKCESILGKEHSGTDFLAADCGGGLILCTQYDNKTVTRVGQDGTTKQSFRVRWHDGSRIPLVGFPDQTGVRCAQDGTFWACDGHAMYRLDSSGKVMTLLGEPPDNLELRDVATAHVDQSGKVYLSDQRNSITHVFDPAGRRAGVLQPDPFCGGDGFVSSIDVSADGHVFIDSVMFDADGVCRGERALPGGEDERYSIGGFVQHQPHAARYWVAGDGRLQLVNETDGSIQKITQRTPNGKWLDRIEAIAVAPDGSIAVGSKSSQGRWDATGTISIYSANGDARRTIEPPQSADLKPGSAPQAFNGRFVLVHSSDYDHPGGFLCDVQTDPPQWFRLDRLSACDDRWWPFFVKDGRELWLLAEDAGRIERYEVPSEPVAAQAIP